MSRRLTVIIPAFNRPGPLQATLRSVADASSGLPAGAVEVLVIDDGSTPPIVEQLQGFSAGIAFVVHRQLNGGSIIARQRGLDAATGEYVQFLDSDDLVHPKKFTAQLEAQAAAGADISYVDIGEAAPGPDHRAAEFRPTQQLRVATTPADFFLRVQPLPHSPIYRREYLVPAFRQPLVPARRAMDASGDAWLYYNLAPRPASILKVDGHYAIVGIHQENRFSQHWEKLGIASLLIAEAFMRATQARPDAREARQTAAAAAFDSWRRLPWDFSPEYQRRLLAIWRSAPSPLDAAAGGRKFAILSKFLGPVRAGRLLRRVRGHRYATCQTLPAADVERLLAEPPLT